MKEFKVGDKVWHPEFGWGEIVLVGVGVISRDYAVDFVNESRRYCGWWELFFKEIELPNPQKPEPNIDWTKVPAGTLVDVRDSETSSWKVEREFLTFVEGTDSPFWVVDVYDWARAEAWRYCRIHSDVEVKKEWLAD